MSKVISLLNRSNNDVVRNHQHFCAQFNYVHQVISTEQIDHDILRLAYKYNVLLQALNQEPENDWVCLLDNNAMVMHPTSIDALLEQRDHLIVNAPPEQNRLELAMVNLLVFRNTAQNRHLLTEIVTLLHSAVATLDIDSEERLLHKFEVMECNANIGGIYANVHWSISQWHNAPVFVVNLGAPVTLDQQGKVRHHIVHDLNLQQLLTQHINAFMFNQTPILSAPNYPEISNDAVSHFNPNNKIAFITLYTHHIATYARVSEHNVKRYCDRHGYAYHVYREVPSEIAQDNVCGSWFKPWLLKTHLADYDWVIWIDADILFRNQTQPIEPILAGRNLLFAKDICDWPINAGVMGFRNTPQNAQLLDNIWARTQTVTDKSSVYSANGDQYHTIEALKEANLLNEQSVVDCLTINTPPNISHPNTLLTHYIGLGEPIRSVYMAHDDLQSKQNHG